MTPIDGSAPAASASAQVSIGLSSADGGVRGLCRAYPPDHPDHEPGDADPRAAASTIDSYLRGEQVGA